MNNEQFDKLIKQKLDELEFGANDMQWAKLQQSLQQATIVPQQVGDDEGEKVAVLPWWNTKMVLRLAAVLLPLITIGVAAALLSKGDADNSTQNVAQNNNAATQSATNNPAEQAPQTSMPATTVAQNTNTNNSQNAVNNSTSNKASIAPGANKVRATINKQNNIVQVQQTPNDVPVNTVQSPNAVEQKNMIAQNNSTGKNNVEQNRATVVAPKTDASNTTSVVMQQQNKDQKQVQMPLMPPMPLRSKGEQSARKYLLAMTTGTGIGRKNQSVAQLGFVAEKAIARKLYIESGINVAHNNLGTIAALTPSQLDNGGATTSSESAFINAADQPKDLATTALVGTTNLSSRTGTFSSDDEVALAIAKVTPRYNIEVVPTIGYNINKRFRVAAGADISRAVFAQDTKDEVQYLQRNASQEIAVRNWDAGLNGKVEVNVTRRIALGYRYRAGLTQVTPGNTTVNTRRNFSNISLRVRLK
jgi:hypothetical protein